MKDFLLSLRTQAWRTAGARYNAARRLKRRELFSAVSLAMFSVLSIAVAFVQRIYSAQQGTPWDNYLTALSVCLGVFLLAISLMEWGARNGAQADALHRNAEDLTGFQLKIAQRTAELEAGQAVNWQDVQDLREEYEVVKSQCQYNHGPIDDLHFRATKRLATEFVGRDGKPSLGGFGAAWIWVGVVRRKRLVLQPVLDSDRGRCPALSLDSALNSTTLVQRLWKLLQHPPRRRDELWRLRRAAHLPAV